MAGRSEREEERLLAALEGALSEGEIRRVLAGALLGLDGAGRERLAARLSARTAEALAGALAAVRGKGAPRPGSAKVRQEWDRAWSDWFGVLAESGDEDGTYFQQDAHWEAPYLDATAVAFDLDRAAARAREHLPRVLAADLDPDLTPAEVLSGTAGEFGAGLPEWVGGGEDGLRLEREATELLLAWEAARALRDGDDVVALARRILDLEALAAPAVTLDPGALEGFLLALPEGEQRALVRALDAGRGDPAWSEVWRNPFSPWARAYRDCAARLDPAAHLRVCREQIAGDFQQALPVLEDLAGRGDADGAAAVVEEALASLLRDEAADPRPRLLAVPLAAQRWLRDDESVVCAVGRILEHAEEAARDRADEVGAQAARLQAAALQEWRRWDRLAAGFRSTPEAPADLRAALLDGLREAVVEASLPWPVRRGSVSTWLEDLLAAAVTGDEAARRDLPDRLRAWIEETCARGDLAGEGFVSLAVLALDLGGEDGTIWRSRPRTRRVLRRAACPGEMSRPLAHSRRRALEAAGAEALREHLLAALTRHAARIVPDPASAARARYEEHADRLAAVRELNEGACRRILEDWRERHRRRRNLWAALGERGIER